MGFYGKLARYYFLSNDKDYFYLILYDILKINYVMSFIFIFPEYFHENI